MEKQGRYVLAVVPGDACLDLQAVKALLEGTYVAFADRERAEELAGSVSGTVLPFSYHPKLRSSPTLRCWSGRRCTSTPPVWTARSPCPTRTTSA
jgi:hypothetical protein